MRTGRPKQPLILTEEERDRLESLAHGPAFPGRTGNPSTHSCALLIRPFVEFCILAVYTRVL